MICLHFIKYKLYYFIDYWKLISQQIAVKTCNSKLKKELLNVEIEIPKEKVRNPRTEKFVRAGGPWILGTSDVF